MNIPNPCRIGWFNPMPEIRYQPFTHEGFYLGDLPPSIPGELFETALEEGTVWFRVGVLYRPDLYAVRKQLQGTLRNQLEVVLCLQPFTPYAALKAMWGYDVFSKETPDEWHRSIGILPEAG